MSTDRTAGLIARYAVKPAAYRIKGAGGLACVVFTAVLGCAFWAGAVAASGSFPH